MKKSRKEALLSGETQYYTGKPCKYGHLSNRQTASGACIECLKAYIARDMQIYRDARNKNKE
ncbi:MAG: hypothetical protein PHH73_02005 [Candidatus Rickettsiella isopodorum]|nr:hypothetical protein [Candidatus Rickettsiella isopodorum]